MEFLKGGHVLLEALPKVIAELGCPLRVTLAGDGPDRQKWEVQAAHVQAQCPDVQIEFTGWVEKLKLDSLLSDTDLLVFPSVWPEPFGLIGPEAGAHGVPVAAFASGGTHDWLSDGINGHLAPGDPPTVEGLALAIIACLHDGSAYSKLSANAVQLASRFELSNHIAALSKIFDKAVESRH